VNLRKILVLIVSAWALSVAASAPASAEGGCYRMGETGYHWYNFCVGPAFLYPHEERCQKHHHDRCWYR
jgi:opacity protein-like surface antigen